jgi:hypothetical protein
MYRTLLCNEIYYNVNAYGGITTIINNGNCNAGVTVEQLPFAPSTSLPRVQCR